MNDERQSPNTEHTDETFNEDFDFGEGETQAHPMKATATKGHNKKIIGLIFFVIVIIALIMGYRAYSPSLSASKNSSHTALNKNPTSVATPNPSQPSKNVNETSEEIKKQSDEFAAALAGITPPAAPVPAPVPVPTPIPAEPKPTLTPAPISAEPTHAPIPTAQKMPEAEKVPHLDEAEAAKLHEALNKLNTQIDSILSQVKYLDAYSREVSDNLNKLNESISTMDSRLLALTNTTSTLSKDVGAVKSEVGQVKEVLKEDGLDINPDPLHKKKQVQADKEGRVVIVEPEYTVHAVVPGRAWLKSVKGQIVSVAEGDSIGNYGKILVIDAANGVVLTSSGVAFR